MLVLPTKLKSTSFHVVNRTRKAVKCTQLRNRAKCAKLLFSFLKMKSFDIPLTVIVVVVRVLYSSLHANMEFKIYDATTATTPQVLHI